MPPLVPVPSYGLDYVHNPRIANASSEIEAVLILSVSLSCFIAAWQLLQYIVLYVSVILHLKHFIDAPSAILVSLLCVLFVPQMLHGCAARYPHRKKERSFYFSPSCSPIFLSSSRMGA